MTGATGFVGRACLAALADTGFKVHAVARTTPADAGGPVWHPADLLDDRQACRVVRAVRPTHLLHLAWEATPGRFWTSSDNLLWAAASVRLVRTFAEVGGKRVVAAGTCAEYDWTVGDGVFQEDGVIGPATLYGVCKDAARRVIEKYCPAVGVEWCWGRVFNPYGPGEPPAKLVGSVVRALAAGEPARCTAGTQVRDYLHVADVAGAFVRLLSGGVQGPVNVGSGEGTSVAEVVTLLGELAGRPDLVRLGTLSDRPGEDGRVVADVSRLRNEAGWRPTVCLREGLAATLGHAWAAAGGPGGLP